MTGRALLRGARRLGRRDEGSIAPMVPILVIAFFILGGLVVDGSRDLNARGEAQAYAEEAARAGATSVNLDSPQLELNEAQARERVAAYCEAVATAGSPVSTCEIDPKHPFTSATTCGGKRARIVVHTKVVMQTRTTLLGIVGLSSLRSAGHAKARPYEGTTADTAC